MSQQQIPRIRISESPATFAIIIKNYFFIFCAKKFSSKSFKARNSFNYRFFIFIAMRGVCEGAEKATATPGKVLPVGLCQLIAPRYEEILIFHSRTSSLRRVHPRRSEAENSHHNAEKLSAELEIGWYGMANKKHKSTHSRRHSGAESGEQGDAERERERELHL